MIKLDVLIIWILAIFGPWLFIYTIFKLSGGL